MATPLSEIAEALIKTLKGVERTAPRALELAHYTKAPHATGVIGEMGGRTFLHKAGTVPDAVADGLRRYEGTYRGHIYDVDLDEVGLVKAVNDEVIAAQTRSYKAGRAGDVPTSNEVFEDVLKGLGYDGYTSRHLNEGAVLFKPVIMKERPSRVSPAPDVRFTPAKVARHIGHEFDREALSIANDLASIHPIQGGGTFTLRDGDLSGTPNYAVEIFPKITKELDTAPSAQVINNFARKFRGLVSMSDVGITSYYKPETGKHYLTAVMVTPDRKLAMALGRRFNQEAVFDLQRSMAIPLGGTGQVPKALQKGDPIEIAMQIRKGVSANMAPLTQNNHLQHYVGKGAHYSIRKDTGEVVRAYAFSTGEWNELAIDATLNGAKSIRILDGPQAAAFHKAGWRAYKAEPFTPGGFPHENNGRYRPDIIHMEAPRKPTNVRERFDTYGRYKHPGFDTLVRADESTRRYVSMGATTVERARTDPRAANLEGTAAVQATLRDLIENDRLDHATALVRALTDYPVDLGEAARWAYSQSTAPLDEFLRSTGSILTQRQGANGASAVNPNVISQADATVVSNIQQAVNDSTYFFKPGQLKGLKSIRVRTREGVTSLEFDPPLNPKGGRPQVERVAPSGAELAAKIGQPGVDKEILDAFSSDALREHVLKRLTAVSNAKHLDNFARKYLSRARAEGADYLKMVLDQINIKVSRMRLGKKETQNLIQRYKLFRTKEYNKEALAVVKELMAKEVTLDDIATTLGVEMNSVEDLGRVIERLMESGQVRATEDLRHGLPVWRDVMHANEAFAFDQQLHSLSALSDVAEATHGRLMHFFGERAAGIMESIQTPGERAAVHLILLDKPRTKKIKFGPLPPNIRAISSPSELREGTELLDLGAKAKGKRYWEVEDPNQEIDLIFSPAAIEAAQRLRNEIYDPLAKLAGLPEGQLLEFYFPRYYHRKTFKDLGEMELLDPKKLDLVKDLDDVALIPGDFRPRREVIFRALLARKLPDLGLYMKDPLTITRMYIQGGTKRVAYRQLLEAWDIIKATRIESRVVNGTRMDVPVWDNKWLRKHHQSESEVGKMVDNWLGDILGYRVTRADRALGEIIRGPQGQRLAAWLESSDHMALRSFGAWLREPGSKPAAKLAAYFKGLMFMRKLGFNPGTVAINLTQPLINNYSQASFASTVEMIEDPAGQAALRDAFHATGTVYDQSKFEGSEGLWRSLLGTDGPFRPDRVGQLIDKTEDYAGKWFRDSEKLNNFQAFALAVIEARQGRVYKAGRGMVQTAPVTDPKLLNLMGLAAARRTQFGGRLNRAPIFRDPFLGLMFQFNTFNFRQTGLLGSQITNAQKAWGRMSTHLKEAEAALVEGKRGLSESLKEKAAFEFVHNVMAPARSGMFMLGTTGLLFIAGVETWSGFGRVFGFVPVLDGRALSQGQVRLIEGLDLGPTFSTPVEITRQISQLRTALSNRPDLLNVRLADLVLSALPVGEVQAKRFAKILLDPRLKDENIFHLILGYRTQGSGVFDEYPFLRKALAPTRAPAADRGPTSGAVSGM